MNLACAPGRQFSFREPVNLQPSHGCIIIEFQRLSGKKKADLSFVISAVERLCRTCGGQPTLDHLSAADTGCGSPILERWD
jgi:hypothetical protein